MKKSDESKPGLAKQVGQAAKWNLSAGFLVRIFSFLTTIVLARLLGPEEFGLFALAFVVIDGFGLFKSLGLESALVQRKDDNPVAADTAFMIIPLMGVVMYLILIVCIPFVADGLESPELPKVLRLLGLIFIINTITRVPYSLLEKRMLFGKRAVAEIVGQLSYSILALVLAFLGFGVWSLVWGYLSMTISKLIVTWYMVDWRPKFRFDKAIAIDMFHFGKFMFLGSVLHFLSANFDRIVVAKELGVGVLGIYAIAYNFADLVNALLGFKVGEVLFPAFSKLQGDLYSLKMAYFRVVKVLVLIVLPFSMGLLFLGGDFLRTAFGDKWLAAIPVLQILSTMSIFHLLIMSAKSVFNGMKKPKLSLVTGIIRVSIYVACILPVGKAYGVNGVAGLVIGTGILAYCFSVYKVSRMLKFTIKEYIVNLRPSFIATVIMVVVMCLVRFGLLETGLPVAIRFIICSICAVGVYAFSVYKIDSDIIRQVRGMLKI